ncbi:MAG TPA: ChbG/HpnK family deacetylase [Epsilonproteobacteria bacterium]|nr:ChbG/HpnK family deacetylase [Campylobacterota bacterium]
MDRIIVNADDLGMTPGTNKAIFEGFDKGAITHTSIMANGDYFAEAMEGMADRRGLGLGIHLNLTYGKALIDNSLYCDEKGFFNLGYLALLMRRDEAFLLAVEREFEAQIQRVLEEKKEERTLTHLDSHRHIHLIPHLYPVVVKLAKKYQIGRVRLVNESLIESLLLTKRYNFILNGGIVKYFLLRGFSLWDARHADLYRGRKFYSILYTGVIGADILQKLKDSPQAYEIMVHPGYSGPDREVFFYDRAEKSYRISEDRERELKTVLLVAKKA